MFFLQKVIRDKDDDYEIETEYMDPDITIVSYIPI